jgi:hypothetical protein
MGNWLKICCPGIMKRGFFLVAVVAALTVSGPADAARDDDLGRTISECFHPFSAYMSVRWGDGHKSGHTVSTDAAVKYRPLNNKVYTMPFTIQIREVDDEMEWRVIPDAEGDTGPMGPDPACKLRNWQSAK